jgi:hypothetical protein
VSNHRRDRPGVSLTETLDFDVEEACRFCPCYAGVCIEIATLHGRNRELCVENAVLRERLAELETALEREQRWRT